MSATPSHDDLETMVRHLEAIPAVRLHEPARWKTAADNAPTIHRFTPLRILGVAAVATCAVIAVIVAASGRPAVEDAQAALPIFHRPAVDAALARPLTPVLAHNRARYGQARQIETSNGPAYVTPAAGDRVCLAVPDSPDGYGESCASPQQIQSRGLAVALTSNKRGVMAAVLPQGASEAKLLLEDGSTRDLPIADGTIAATASGEARVSYTIGERRFSVRLFSTIRCIVMPDGPHVERKQFAEAAKKAGLPLCTG